MRRALLLTGTLGVGKTAVAVEVGWRLAQRGLVVAVIDLDWLGWVHPPAHEWPEGRVDELIADNLATIAGNYALAGIHDLVLARTLLRPSALVSIRERLAAAEIKVFRLHASARTIGERLRRRDSGRELEDHLAEAGRYAELSAALVADAVIGNDGRPLSTVAEEVIQHSGW